MTAGAAGATVRVRLFAAAAEAAGTDETVAGPGTAAAVRVELESRFGPEFAHVLRQSALVSGGRRLEAADPVEPDALADVLPPFAGG